MRLSNETKSAIKQHAKREAPKECCGFIFDDGGVYEADNTSSDKNKFSISTKDYIEAHNAGDVKAIYHSHPKTGSVFSEYDKFNSINHEILYVLYSMKDNSFTQFDPSLSAFNKYIGREFEIGKTDCFALIKDFYEFELDIKLNEHYRDEKYEQYLGELFDVNFELEGFSVVDLPQKYDCILFKERKGKFSNHIALYLGGDLILHQPQKNYSRIEEYTNRHRTLTNYIIRHKQWKTV